MKSVYRKFSENSLNMQIISLHFNVIKPISAKNSIKVNQTQRKKKQEPLIHIIFLLPYNPAEV